MEEERDELEPREEEKPREAVDWSALFDAMADMVEEEKLADVLEERAGALAEPEEEETADAGDVYTLFTLREEKYALPAVVTREVLELPKITPVPKAPAVVAGLFHRWGGVYVALNTKYLLGLEEDGSYGEALVFTSGGARVALLVDAVEATRHIPPAYVRSSDVGGRAIAGVTPDRYIVLDGTALWSEVRRALGL
jgi:chemotaxis signal transduction protein